MVVPHPQDLPPRIKASVATGNLTPELMVGPVVTADDAVDCAVVVGADDAEKAIEPDLLVPEFALEVVSVVAVEVAMVGLEAMLVEVVLVEVALVETVEDTTHGSGYLRSTGLIGMMPALTRSRYDHSFAASVSACACGDKHLVSPDHCKLCPTKRSTLAVVPVYPAASRLLIDGALHLKVLSDACLLSGGPARNLSSLANA